MPAKIAHAETVHITRRDGTQVIVQEWPTLVAMDALDDIIDAYDDLKDSGVINSIMNVRLDVTDAHTDDGGINPEKVVMDRSSQADQFVGILKALKGYRPKFLELLCTAIVVPGGQEDLKPGSLNDWFADELYDLVYGVYEVNFVKGSLKKVREKMAARSPNKMSETTSETAEAVPSETA